MKNELKEIIADALKGIDLTTEYDTSEVPYFIKEQLEEKLKDSVIKDIFFDWLEEDGYGEDFGFALVKFNLEIEYKGEVFLANLSAQYYIDECEFYYTGAYIEDVVSKNESLEVIAKFLALKDTFSTNELFATISRLNMRRANKEWNK